MQDNAAVNFINKKIKIHGSNEYGDPLFRVVFSDDQVENRKGTFDDFSGNIFIRRVTEVRECKKYPWIKGKWLIERWISGEKSYHRDLQTFKNGVYIVVYVFQDKDYNYLPPLLKVTEIVISNLLHPRPKSVIINQDTEILAKEENIEVDNYIRELEVASDESKTKDSKSNRESMSSGYTKSLIKEGE